MGKKGGASWLTAVKRAFRSPTKDTTPTPTPDKSRNCRRKEDHHHHHHQDDQDDEKKKEKRRWLFKKSTPQQDHKLGPPSGDDLPDQRQVMAVAAAAVATAQAAMEVARLARPPPTTSSSVNIREHNAAIVIQTAFRGYLARRALRALKGLVKLQALVRGHNVRRQAKMTLKCMQALVRVQARVLNQRISLSHEGSRKSTFSDTNSLLESRYLQDLPDRRSVSHSRGPSSIADDWDERPHTIEEVKAMLLSRQEAAFKREKNLSLAFSHQMWRSDRSSVGGEEELVEEKPRWVDRRMAYKSSWDSTPGPTRARASTDHRDNFKTVEIDTSQPFSYSAPTARRSVTMSNRPPSPLHGRAHHSHSHSQSHYQYHQHPPAATTPSPSRARPIQVRSASPRCFREDSSYTSSVSQTPSLRSNHYYNANLNPTRVASSSFTHGGNIPNYMAATESAKARVRSQSAPRQRPSTPERDRGSGGGAKKRLSFPNQGDPYSYANYNLRSPSFKSVMEQHSNYSSCCTESLGGEISPSSTTDLRRWLR